MTLQLTLAREAARLWADLDAQGAATSMWAIATLRLDDPAVLGALCRACVARSAAFTPQNASNAYWGAATLRATGEGPPPGACAWRTSRSSSAAAAAEPSGDKTAGDGAGAGGGADGEPPPSVSAPPARPAKR